LVPALALDMGGGVLINAVRQRRYSLVAKLGCNPTVIGYTPGRRRYVV
jgi:hypothetical protein